MFWNIIGMINQQNDKGPARIGTRPGNLPGLSGIKVIMPVETQCKTNTCQKLQTKNFIIWEITENILRDLLPATKFHPLSI